MTISDCFTYLCNFHREQSWERWLKSSCTGIDRKDVLQKFRDIANADSEESFKIAVTSLKETHYWKDNEHMRVWFERQWLSVSKRWVLYHRQSLQNIRVTTTNGLERQHCELKQNYLKNYTSGTVTSLINTITNQFLPDSFKRYIEGNVRCLDTSRMYSDAVPHFLRNRPKLFLDHCTKRLPSAIMIPLTDIAVLSGQKFKVSGSDGSQEYMLDLSDSLPKCSCPDWKRFHFPCKHMLSVLLKVEGCGWDDLSEEFTGSPFINVDKVVCSNTYISTPASEQSSDGLNSSSDNLETPTISRRHVTNKSLEPNMVALGSKCKMIASSIHSMLHLIQNASDYEPVYCDLLSLHAKIRALVPKEAGLLKRHSRAGKKPYKHGLLKPRRRYRKVSSKSLKSVRNVKKKSSERAKVVPIDSFFQTDDVSTVITGNTCTQDSHVNVDEHGKKDKECAKDVIACNVIQTEQMRQDSCQVKHLVDKIWSLKKDYNIPVAKPYGIVVTDADIRSLKDGGWLTDNILDCHLNMIVTEAGEQSPRRNGLHLVTTLMTSIVSGQYQINQERGFRYKLSDYDFVVGIYGRGAHWTLILAEISSTKLFFYNPTGENPTERYKILKNWRKFIRQYNAMCSYEKLPLEWSITSRKHTLQTDSNNCGVFCMLFAEKHIKEVGMEAITADELTKCRRNVAEKVLFFEDCITDCCPKCGFLIEEDNQIQCGKCYRTYHFKQYCVGEAVEGMKNDDKEFICQLCSIGLWVHTGRIRKISDKTVQFTRKFEDQATFDSEYPNQILMDGPKKNVRKSLCLKRKKDVSHGEPSKKRKDFDSEDKKGEKKEGYAFAVDGDSDDEPGEDEFLYSKKSVEGMIEIALERVKNIISMKNRDAPWMKRHCSFRKGGRFLKRGFGFALFSQQALFFVEQCLLEHFFTDTTGLAYSRHGRVIGMEDEAMIRIFQNDRYLAQNYIKEVCVREALLSIVSKTLKLRYSESEVLLTDTEGQSVIVALERSFKKCKMNKEKWCGKLDSFKESRIIA
ncbi:uncharacterized protein LOC132721701 isoform X2 [Ruditapes philippinarum]|uniref:uncharacterized protein LOC132721701 isoform X2 n=1 Tax=Ruditapes philippinarum TaxID=129788 RepID=UPI00295B0A77|nr:uncharacterized protein LOC132721701 isoform X2 [Ruditapes philippinarum]